MEPIYELMIAEEITVKCCEKQRYVLSLLYPGRVRVISENTRAEMKFCKKCGLDECAKGK